MLANCLDIVSHVKWKTTTDTALYIREENPPLAHTSQNHYGTQPALWIAPTPFTHGR